MPLQIAERLGGIGERRPVADRTAIGDALAPAYRDRAFLPRGVGGKRSAADRDQVSPAFPSAGRTHGARAPAKSLRESMLRAARRSQRFQGLQHAGFPVDQRAVAIEAEGRKIGQFHERRSKRALALAPLSLYPSSPMRPALSARRGFQARASCEDANSWRARPPPSWRLRRTPPLRRRSSRGSGRT